MSVLSKLTCDFARSMHKQCSMNWCILEVCVWRDFNLNVPNWVVEELMRSLEIKWSIIKHDVSKFVDVCGVVIKFEQEWNIFKTIHFIELLNCTNSNHKRELSFV
jgi:hypothetical protein